MELQKRKPNRLKNYDYSQNGAYFITICTKDRKPILSVIENADETVEASIARPPKIQLTDVGLIVDKAINGISIHYQNVFIDNYVIMPNHVHLIIRIDNNGRAMLAPTISRIIQQFKGYITKQIGESIWQKLYYDHIIRDNIDYQNIWQYIDENPTKWAEDKYNTNI